MNLGTLTEGVLIQRYQRFFAEIQHPDQTITAHIANTGSMRSLLLPDSQGLCAYVAGPQRKLDWSLKLIRLPHGALACVDTSLPNKIVHEALESGVIPTIPLGSVIQPEQVAAPGTRLDFRIQCPNGQMVWIEVKNVTLVEPSSPDTAQFPDAVSTRGLKHLNVLSTLCAQGDRAIILYLVNRTDAHRFQAAQHIDPHYALALERALQSGVEKFVCYTDIFQDQDQWFVKIKKVEHG